MRVHETTKPPKVFLGGTCNGSRWRDIFITMLNGVEAFNPVVEEWNEEAQARELRERETADFVLYVLTPMMTGFYSVAEVVDDSNKRPEKTVLVVLPHDGDSQEIHEFSKAQQKSLDATVKLVERNGATTFGSLSAAADYFNSVASYFNTPDAIGANA